MFGYVTPLSSELKVREFEYFRSYYHGLCYSLKDNFGNVPRLSLNYDMTFIGFLLEGLNNTPLMFEKKRCIKHPSYDIVKVSKTDALDYVSHLTIIFFNYKLRDNIVDDKNLKSKTLYLFFKPYEKNLSKSYTKIQKDIEFNISQLSMLERTCSFTDLDEIADPFGRTLGNVLKNYPHKFDDDSPSLRDELYHFGYCLGKYIYLIDALDDLKDDIENNSFNPINVLYNDNCLSYSEVFNKISTDIEMLLLSCVSDCYDSYKRLPLKKHGEILENVISLGMVNKYYEVLTKYKKNEP